MRGPGIVAAAVLAPGGACGGDEGGSLPAVEGPTSPRVEVEGTGMEGVLEVR